MALPQAELRTLNLELRRISFGQELAQMKLPQDQTGLVEMAREMRERGIEAKYKLVFIFYQLERKGGNYWTQYGCKSIDEFLTKLDLPIGSTLDKWLGVVEMFSKETILTLGEDSIFLMQRLITKAQPNLEKQKDDYRAILDEYCRRHADFDKTEFEKTVNWFVNTRYVKPAGLKVVSNIAPPPRDLPTGSRATLTTRPLEKMGRPQAAPVLSRKFVVETKIDTFRDVALRHIETLESEIKRLGGCVPDRPAALK